MLYPNVKNDQRCYQDQVDLRRDTADPLKALLRVHREDLRLMSIQRFSLKDLRISIPDNILVARQDLPALRTDHPTDRRTDLLTDPLMVRLTINRTDLRMCLLILTGHLRCRYDYCIMYLSKLPAINPSR